MSDFNHTVTPISETGIKKKSTAWNYFGILNQNGVPVPDNYFYCKKCVEEKKLLTIK